MTTKDMEGGWAWAAPEMVYEEAEHVAAPGTAPGLWTPDQGPAPKLADLAKQIKKTANVMAGRPPTSSSVKLATAGGAKVDMVMSRQLAHAVQEGLGGAWLALGRKSMRALPDRLRPRLPPAFAF